MTTAAVNLLYRDPVLTLLDEELRRVVEQTPCAVPESLWRRALFDPLREFLARPRKGLRAAFVEAGWRLGGGDGAPPIELPAVVEILHAGSLIIDDIEDGSDVRRAGPAMHLLHGAPVAINAGNWLYFWSLSLLERIRCGGAERLELYRMTADTFLACHHGQAMDLALHVADLDRGRIPQVVRAVSLLKTATLVRYALLLGGRVAGAPDQRLKALDRLGEVLGVLVQMLDDLGGLTRQERRIKGHEDLLNGRPTWPWAWLARHAGAGRFETLRELACEVHLRETHQEVLAERMRTALGTNGHRAVNRQVVTALSILESSFEPGAVVQDLSEQIRALEAIYA